MQLVGQNVTHDIFGEGRVTYCDKNLVSIHFSQGEKKFVFPDAFATHLSLGNADLQGRVLGILRGQEAEKEAHERAVEAQLDREAFLRNLKISVRSQGVFDIAPQEEAAVFDRWSLSAGTYLSGFSKGNPRIPDRLKPNSMCLVTLRPQGAPEKERQIAGFFMVPDTFNGADCTDGMVPAHETYRIRLAPENRPLFWPFLQEAGEQPRWGSTCFKYLSNTVGEEILFALKEQLTTADSREQAGAVTDFYAYYCRLNRLHPLHPGKGSTQA